VRVDGGPPSRLSITDGKLNRARLDELPGKVAEALERERQQDAAGEA